MTDKFTNLNNTDHITPDNIASINPKPPPFDDLYFETTNDFHTADYIVKKEGHLSKLWTTTDLYCVKSGYSGIYLAYDLHKRPHYMKSPSQFTMMEKKQRKKALISILSSMIHGMKKIICIITQIFQKLIKMEWVI